MPLVPLCLLSVSPFIPSKCLGFEVFYKRRHYRYTGLAGVGLKRKLEELGRDDETGSGFCARGYQATIAIRTPRIHLVHSWFP
ncbi:uncharacterized protein F4822DRAFT_404806 [Hypoxylon trugodes]|uniref:uncharacterized protein n=1 Tax=Hypoxylon trugodes TaxID=326681 RepID=UPI00218E7633|nr:uncharacterized protein F4822DRAFT_404806 [Hypoxylon trugodes]KAI1389049.1 hypothetical protein F4822DRAFT_404806 [Hypoxylon trugodes]